MSVVGVTMVKDEADIIGTTLRHMATQVDGIIVADNMSTDGTSEILLEVAHEVDIPVVIVEDRVVAYNQSRKMTALARQALVQFHADWIVPFDADEIWLRTDGKRIGDCFNCLEHHVVGADLYDHVVTGLDDWGITDPIDRITWRRPYATSLPKVACRASKMLTIGMGNHDVRYGRHAAAIDAVELVVHHYPNRSVDQLVKKVRNGAAAYAASRLPSYYGAHWREWGKLLDEGGEAAIEELFLTWYYRKDPTVEAVIGGELQGPLVQDRPGVA